MKCCREAHFNTADMVVLTHENGSVSVLEQGENIVLHRFLAKERIARRKQKKKEQHQNPSSTVDRLPESHGPPREQPGMN